MTFARVKWRERGHASQAAIYTYPPHGNFTSAILVSCAKPNDNRLEVSKTYIVLTIECPSRSFGWLKHSHTRPFSGRDLWTSAHAVTILLPVTHMSKTAYFTLKHCETTVIGSSIGNASNSHWTNNAPSALACSPTPLQSLTLLTFRLSPH